MPLVGTGEGGRREDRGSLLQGILELLLDETRLDVDFVVVARHPQDFSALQAVRRELALGRRELWSDLTSGLTLDRELVTLTTFMSEQRQAVVGRPSRRRRSLCRRGAEERQLSVAGSDSPCHDLIEWSAMPESDTTTPILTDRFDAALTLASDHHRRQLRKGTAIPYVAHLLAVTAIVLEMGAARPRRSAPSSTTRSRTAAAPRCSSGSGRSSAPTSLAS